MAVKTAKKTAARKTNSKSVKVAMEHSKDTKFQRVFQATDEDAAVKTVYVSKKVAGDATSITLTVEF